MDPGVLVSARIASQGKGAPAQLLSAWLAKRFEIIVSTKLLAELEEVLLRPEFQRYLNPGDVHSYIELLANIAIYECDFPVLTAGITPDPKDDYLVLLARSVGADFLISGDAHLTGVSEPDPPILIPRAFLNLLSPPDQK